MAITARTTHNATIEFDNSFQVPMEPERAWRVLSDIRNIAGCIPGAELTKEIDAKNFEGRFSVPLGPVTLAFSGLVRVEELDAPRRYARISARGSEANERGGASGVATFEVRANNGGSTVAVHTEIHLSGMAARYGENVGAVQATAEETLSRFAKNLEMKITQTVTA